MYKREMFTSKGLEIASMLRSYNSSTSIFIINVRVIIKAFDNN
jgi:hypothetical protein